MSGGALDRAADPRPLEGMRVVEVGTYVAVPSACAHLAMLGADVVRVDPIGGASDHRRAPLAPDGDSIYWASLNKGVRSLALDLRGDEGRDLARRLITAPGPDRGLFVTNAVGRGWLSYDALRSHRDDLVMVHLEGRSDGTPAVDYTINCEVGFPAITGDVDGPDVAHALPAWDLLAGAQATVALLAAERRRARTGVGDLITISLADVALAATDGLGYLAEVQVTGAGRERTGSFVYGTFGAPFSTGDHQRVMIVALTARQWVDLVDLTGTAGLVSALEQHLEVDFTRDVDRFAHRDLLREVLVPWFAARDVAAVTAALDRTRVLAARFRTFGECVASEDVQDNDLFATVDHPQLGRLRAAGAPGRFRGASGRPRPLAPVLGADTEQVLADDLGLGAAEIGRLHDHGVVASATCSRSGPVAGGARRA